MSLELRGTYCGTPIYLSPEILQGTKYDEKIDVWSIGVLTYEILVGKPPFKIKCNSDLNRIVSILLQRFAIKLVFLHMLSFQMMQRTSSCTFSRKIQTIG